MIFDSLAKRNEFIESNLGLVKSRVMKLNRNTFNDDLYQVGSLALVVATDRFNKNVGVEFSTYAVKYIDGYILKHKKYDTLIKPLRKGSKTWSFYYKDIVSLNEKVNDSETYLEDIIPSDEDIENCVVENIVINDFLNDLSDRDRLILKLAIEGVKQSKISQIVCINQSSVSRVVNRRGKQYMSCYGT